MVSTRPYSDWVAITASRSMGRLIVPLNGIMLEIWRRRMMSDLLLNTIQKHKVALMKSVTQFFCDIGSSAMRAWIVTQTSVSWFLYSTLKVVVWTFVGILGLRLAVPLMGVLWTKHQTFQRERERERERQARSKRVEAQRRLDEAQHQAQEQLRAKEESEQRARMAQEAERRRTAEAARRAQEARDAAYRAEQERKQYRDWKEHNDRVFHARCGNLSYPPDWSQGNSGGSVTLSDVFAARCQHMKRLFKSTGDYANTLKEERNRWHPNHSAIPVLDQAGARQGEIIEMVTEISKVIGHLYDELECKKSGQAA